MKPRRKNTAAENLAAEKKLFAAWYADAYAKGARLVGFSTVAPLGTVSLRSGYPMKGPKVRGVMLSMLLQLIEYVRARKNFEGVAHAYVTVGGPAISSWGGIGLDRTLPAPLSEAEIERNAIAGKLQSMGEALQSASGPARGTPVDRALRLIQAETLFGAVKMIREGKHLP